MIDLKLIGAGGTGTHVLPPLITWLHSRFPDTNSWRLSVIDGDNVEVKNLERQLFHIATVNENKARAALMPYKHMSNLKPVNEYLGKDNIQEHITDGSIVLIAVDNFPVRALIEDHCLALDNIIVINGGNEFDTGSCQIWIRKDGKNLTPPLSFLHPEIRREGKNRADLSCQEIAQLPGGEQLIVTNMSSATYMLLALMAVMDDAVTWTEAQFSLSNPSLDTYTVDNRERKGWA